MVITLNISDLLTQNVEKICHSLLQSICNMFLHKDGEEPVRITWGYLGILGDTWGYFFEIWQGIAADDEVFKNHCLQVATSGCP